MVPSPATPHQAAHAVVGAAGHGAGDEGCGYRARVFAGQGAHIAGGGAAAGNAGSGQGEGVDAGGAAHRAEQAHIFGIAPADEQVGQGMPVAGEFGIVRGGGAADGLPAFAVVPELVIAVGAAVAVGVKVEAGD